MKNYTGLGCISIGLTVYFRYKFCKLFAGSKIYHLNHLFDLF